MKRISALVIGIIALIGLIAIAIHQFIVLKEWDTRTTTSLLLALCVIGITLARILSGQGRVSHRAYRQQYDDILKTAFAEDRISRRRLYQAIDLFSQHQALRAVKKLDRLLPVCKLNADYAAVQAFRGLSLEEAGRTEEAIAAYEEAVQYDKWISTVWSNLGLLYMRTGESEKAIRAYEQAILADDSNPYAHNNLAAAHLRAGRTDDAIRSAQKALERNPRMFQAMSALAIALRMKGDLEASEQYAQLYALNGGDGQKLRQQLESVQAVAPSRASAQIDRIKQQLDATRKPLLRIGLTDAVPELTDSKIGGIPYLPRGTSYPLDSQGRPLRLLCQIDCRCCSGLPRSSGFPQQGLLQFFIRPDGLCGLDLDDQTRQDGFRVLYHPVIDPTVTEIEVRMRMPPIDETAVFPVAVSCRLSFTSDEERISRDDARFSERFTQLTGTPPRDLPPSVYTKIAYQFDGFGHKVGGYPAFTQEDPRVGELYDRYDTLLLQLDSDNAANPRILWGDSGVCSFFIGQDRLRRLDFSDVLYHWDCY